DASRAARQASARAAVTRRPARRPIMGGILLQGLGLEADLAVLGLETEAHGLSALLAQDAVGLLGDQLAEAFELHRPGLAGLLPLLQEPVEQRAHGLAVALRVLDADLARRGRPRRGAIGGRG